MLSSSLTSGARRHSNHSAQRRRRQGGNEIRTSLRVTRRCAVKARAQSVNQLKNLLISAPEKLKSELCGASAQRSWWRRSRGFGRAQIPRTCRRPPNSHCARLARRHQRLSEEICELDEQLDRLVAEAAPELVALEGVGTDTAASLLIAALVTIPIGSTTRQPSRTPVRSRTDPSLFGQEECAPSFEPARKP